MRRDLQPTAVSRFSSANSSLRSISRDTPQRNDNVVPVAKASALSAPAADIPDRSAQSLVASADGSTDTLQSSAVPLTPAAGPARAPQSAAQNASPAVAVEDNRPFFNNSAAMSPAPASVPPPLAGASMSSSASVPPPLASDGPQVAPTQAVAIDVAAVAPAAGKYLPKASTGAASACRLEVLSAAGPAIDERPPATPVGNGAVGKRRRIAFPCLCGQLRTRD